MIEIEKEKKAKKLERQLTGMFPTEDKAPTYREYLEVSASRHYSTSLTTLQMSFQEKAYCFILVWLRNRLISGGLEPVLSQTEKICIASYYTYPVFYDYKNVQL